MTEHLQSLRIEAIEAVEHYFYGFKAVDIEIEVKFGDLPPKIMGRWLPDKKIIEIRRGMDDYLILQAITHEYLHSMGMDDCDENTRIARGYFPPVNVIRYFRKGFIDNEKSQLGKSEWMYVVECYRKKKQMTYKYVKNFNKEFRDWLMEYGWFIDGIIAEPRRGE